MHQRIKGTLGITALPPYRVRIERGMGDLDVVLLRPYIEVGIKG